VRLINSSVPSNDLVARASLAELCVELFVDVALPYMQQYLACVSAHANSCRNQAMVEV
jgi:hypothetical protein